VEQLPELDWKASCLMSSKVNLRDISIKMRSPLWMSTLSHTPFTSSLATSHISTCTKTIQAVTQQPLPDMLEEEVEADMPSVLLPGYLALSCLLALRWQAA